MKRCYFRGDAAFANPEIYEFLEAEDIAVRLFTCDEFGQVRGAPKISQFDCGCCGSAAEVTFPSALSASLRGCAARLILEPSLSFARTAAHSPSWYRRKTARPRKGKPVQRREPKCTNDF